VQPADNPPNSDGLGVYHGTIPDGQFGYTDNPDRQFGNGSVWTRTRTRSDGLEPLLTLFTYKQKRPQFHSFCTGEASLDLPMTCKDVNLEEYESISHLKRPFMVYGINMHIRTASAKAPTRLRHHDVRTYTLQAPPHRHMGPCMEIPHRIPTKENKPRPI